AAPSTPAPPAAVEPPATTPAPTAATPVPSQATPPVASAPPATVEPVAPAPAPPTARSSTEPRSSDGAAVESGPAARAPASPPWPMWLGVGPSLAWGIAPAITADGRLFFGVRRRDLSLEVGAEASLPSTSRQPDGSGF